MRPAPVQQPAIAPPFDAVGPGGELVHTVLPPDQVLPTTPTRLWWCGDAWSVTLPKGKVPFVPDANTTPIEAVMSYFLPKYWMLPGGRVVVDDILTAHAQRTLSHFHLDRFTWDQVGMPLSTVVDMVKYIQSWGFYTSYWAFGTKDGHPGSMAAARVIVRDALQAIIQAGSSVCEKTILVLGEELNSTMDPGPNGLDGLIEWAAPICHNAGILLATHFTSNYSGYPAGSQTVTDWWLENVGKVDINLWQGNPADDIGALCAHHFDTRKVMAASKIPCAFFESWGERVLYGEKNEQDCQRGGWCGICATTDEFEGFVAGPVAGAGGGLVYPNGTPILP